MARDMGLDTGRVKRIRCFKTGFDATSVVALQVGLAQEYWMTDRTSLHKS